MVSGLRLCGRTQLHGEFLVAKLKNDSTGGIMADSIELKDFESHLDNLIPGVILSAEILALGLPVPPGLHQLPSFATATVFVAASYAFGLVSALTSRLLLDSLSEYWLRGLVFERLVHSKRPDLLNYYKDKDPKFASDMEYEKGQCEKKKRHTIESAEWNTIYRSALRLSVRPEVDRRRAQGRLVRNLVLPAMLGVPILALPWPSTIILIVISFACMCFLYSYAELNNMAEAHDITANISQPEPSN
jgi:hypothetical protein